MPKVIASWIERYATRLIELQPDVRPLDAVRNATAAFPEASNLAPENAAEANAAAGRPAVDAGRDHEEWSTSKRR